MPLMRRNAAECCASWELFFRLHAALFLTADNSLIDFPPISVFGFIKLLENGENNHHFIGSFMEEVKTGRLV